MATLKRFNSERDVGMQRADDALQDLESRINQVYKEAADGVTQKLNTFLERFEAQDVEMRAAVDRGEISQSEYSIWRRNKILRTEQMRGQIESLTNDMVNADKMALGMINDDLVDVYVNGYNFSGFRGEMMAQAAGYNYSSFSIYNADAMRIILTEDPDLIPWMEPDVNIPADMRWNRKHIQNAIAQGILQGDSIPDISKRLLPLVNMDRNAAKRTARTSYTAVQNEGRRDATRKIKEAGIPMQEPWMALLADNTRDTHLMLHGTFPNEKGLYGEGIIPTGNLLRFPADPLGDPEQIYNCRCRVNSFLFGIDHSRDDELYEKMMREEFYDDWVGDKNATGVKDYKIDEQRRALERKRQLDSGERESNVARRYRRQQEKANGTATNTIGSTADIEWKESELSKTLEQRVGNPLQFERMTEKMTDEQIVNKISGGDLTDGSCMSLACVYSANNAGYDVMDFRGGASQKAMSQMRQIKMLSNMDGVVSFSEKNANDIKSVHNLLKNIENANKPYILVTGKHAAVIKKVDEGFQYLELQSATNSGWKSLDDYVLRRRFKAQKSHSSLGMKYEAESLLIDSETLGNSEQFPNVLQYINTKNPLRGGGGREK